MNAIAPLTAVSIHRTSIWLIAVSFVLFQFFLQLSSGIVISTIMHDMSLTAFTAGLLSSAFYVMYTGLQIPVGILFDKKNTRRLLATNALLCSIGCFLFASCHHLFGLFLGRLLMGSGSAFAFIGLSHLLRRHYPLKQFAFMMGLSETLGFIATVIGILAMGSLISVWGWRGFINSAGLLGLGIAYVCWYYLPHESDVASQTSSSYKHQLLLILLNPKAWINGLFVGLSFTVVTAFGALWAVPFIQVKLHCGLQLASQMGAFFFIGTALSCPLFGLLSARLNQRKPLMVSSSLSTAALLCLLLYLPTQNTVIITSLLFFIGLCCGAYMLAYTIANEIAPNGSLSTCTGFTNMLAVITTPLLQSFIGYLLDVSHHTTQYTNVDYQHALITLPISLLIASVLVYFLPEKEA